MNSVAWNEQFKIRIANSDKSFEKHEIIKTLLVMKLIEKNRSNKSWIRIYTEWDLFEDTICDIYFEDIKNKVCYAFEIQKKIDTEWTNRIVKKYKDWEVFGFNSADLIIVPIQKLSDDLNILSTQLDEYIF
jgi:hypothetical protein